MKILVLGNGFDLDHNLPTSYMDFLKFCNYVTERTEESFNKLKPTQQKYADKLKSKRIKKLKIKKKTKTKIKIKKIIKLNKNGLNHFSPLLKNNRLLKYFNSRVATQGENWIDFEREIKSVVNEFKAIEFEFRQSNQYSYKIDKNHKINIILKTLGLDNYIQESWGENVSFAIHKKMCCSFNNFSKALELYIYLFVNKTDVNGVSPDIVNFEADRVITFNYSNTYERSYSDILKNKPIDYVHGNAIEKRYNNSCNESNIVLGIDTDDKNLEKYYVEFEKYYQRITKRTGNKYKKWLQEGKRFINAIEIMFFGHSLDVADSDIIRDLIYYDKSIVKIYYFDEKSHQQIVANLIEIIGKKDLIDFVWGPTPKIEFIKQRKHLDNNAPGFEITRDLKALSRVHTLSSTEINELINRITDKIQTQDWDYFHSQNKALSLLNALKYYDLELVTQYEFLKICEKLNYVGTKSGKLGFYSLENSFALTSQAEKEMSQLIKINNISNEKKSLNTKPSKPSISYFEISSLKSSEEVQKFLLKLFEQDCPYDDYSKELKDLFKSMYKKKDFFEEAFHLIKKTDLSNATRIKFRCFKKDYYEHIKKTAINTYKL